jgi:hypothetical protein
MSLVLLAISLSVALGVLAFRFAVFALPVMVGIAAFTQVQEGGAGFGLSVTLTSRVPSSGRRAADWMSCVCG